MRRFPSGTTDQYIYFVAVDATDLKTRETGLTTFTVYRARNGGTATAYTTPTVAEVSSSNMPGVYSLLLDEDMTIGSGNKSEEVVLHITQASMAPVTLVYELYRPDVTDGETLTVSSGNANAAVQSIANNALTASAIASDAITAAKIASDAGTEIGTAVWASTTRVLTAGTNIALAKGTGITGFNDLDAAGVRSAVGLASANLDTQLSTIDTVVDAVLVDTAEIGTAGAGLTALASAANLSTLTGYVDTEVAAIKTVTDKLDDTLEDQGGGVYGFTSASLQEAPSAGGGGPTAEEIADEVQTRTIAAVTVVNGLAANSVTASVLASDAVTEIQSGLATSSALSTVAGYIDTEVAAIKAKTDNLPSDPADASVVAGLIAAVEAKVDTIDGIVDAILVDTAEIGAAGAGLTALASATNLATVDTVVDAIKAKTDSLTFTVSGVLDTNIHYVNDVEVTGDGSSGTPWGP